MGLEKRGFDATGIATIRGNGDIWVEKAELEATEFVKHRTALDKRIKTILLHTRAATKGHQSNNLNNHPVINNNAVIIHNGHIRNDDELFLDKNLNRTAEVDSEAIAALFDKFGIEKAHLALQELEGGFAVGAIDQRVPTALVLAKGKMSPLTYYKNKNYIIWASESKIILDSLEKVDYKLNYSDIDHMRDGDILYMDNGQIEELSFKVKEPVYTYKKSKPFMSGWHWDDDKNKKQAEIAVAREAIPRYGAYEILIDGRKVTYRCCHNCGIAANQEYFRAFDGGHWCPTCFEDEIEWLTKNETCETAVANSEIEKENAVLREWESDNDSESEFFDHDEICEKIGKLFGLTGDIVDYFLFECQDLMDKRITNAHIIDLYENLSTLYDIELGLVVGDEEEKEDSKAKKMEIVKFKENEQKFIGL